ncbi:bestrophin family protein [Janthinobacterium sp. 17J80-10]|uniref:bestrophin family protein n=1 Tax=Janthinobacterium sp. 17J80-10 TaxID=2497863 RepID=UPI0010053369|nr:bestrophin family protein [Janthinobacterium sp. 17J80-10]QAU34182.1 bestrophin [Janthinobacterium sp. 17J80-10]
MIVRDRPSGLRLFLTMRGSILSRIWKSLAVTTLLAILVTYTDGALLHHKITLTTIPFTLIGLPLAIFLGFRNNSAYDRYWEGRKLWGEVVLRSNNFARQCLSLIGPASLQPPGSTDLRTRMIHRAIAFAHALRHHLRDSDSTAELQHLLEKDEWRLLAKASNKPNFLMNRMGEDLRRCIDDGRIDSCLVAAIDATMSALVSAAASCERIRNTPIPFSYTLLLHRTAYLYCFLLPFGLVDLIGFMTPFVVGIVAYTFFGLDALGDEIEEPFGVSANDLPLDAICRAIEINLRESLGEESSLRSLVPVDYQLT